MVYPEFPDTFWSFKHALRFIRKKALAPPLGLLTVAAMLPTAWEKRLVDLNVTHLTQQDRISLDGRIRILDGDRLVTSHRLRPVEEGWVTVPSHHARLWRETLNVEARDLAIYAKFTKLRRSSMVLLPLYNHETTTPAAVEQWLIDEGA